MKFFQEDYIKNLPDCYDKEKTGNFYKLMQLLRYDEDKYRALLQKVDDCLSLDTATGYALDLYGDMVGQNRGSATDEQYRALIALKMAMQRSAVDTNSIISSLSSVLGISPESFSITDAETSGYVDVTLPVDTLMGAGLGADTVYEAINELLAAGVGMRTIHVTQEVPDAKLLIGNAMTLGENFIADVEAIVTETVAATFLNATALTFVENYYLEVS